MKEIGLIFLIIVGSITCILFNVFVSRQLGPEDYGDFKVAEAFFYLFSLCAAMGGAAAAPKFLDQQINLGMQNGSWEYIKFYSLLILSVSLFLAILVLIMHELHVSIFDGSSFHAILIALIIVPVYSIYNLFGSLLQTANKIGLAVLPYAMGYGIISGAVFAVMIYLFDELNENHTITAVLMTISLLLIFNFYKLKQLNLMPISKAKMPETKSKWLAVSLPLMFASAAQYLLQKLDIFMIEILGNEGAVGHFAAAQSVSWIFFDLEFGLTYLFAIQVINAQKKGKENLISTIKGSVRFSLFCSLPFLIAIVIFGHEALIFYKYDSELAYKTLMILSFGYMIFLLATGPLIWLQYNGKQNQMVYLFIGGIIINSALNWVLLPILDIEGAAIATTISMIFIAVSVVIITIRHLNEDKKELSSLQLTNTIR